MEPCRVSHFNSIKVLELTIFTHLIKKFSNFNSIKVRLEPSRKTLPDGSDLNFNSIKVRLERINPYFALGNIQAFQFHKGTIRTGIGFKLECFIIELFQFHKGTIRTSSSERS